MQLQNIRTTFGKENIQTGAISVDLCLWKCMFYQQNSLFQQKSRSEWEKNYLVSQHPILSDKHLNSYVKNRYGLRLQVEHNEYGDVADIHLLTYYASYIYSFILYQGSETSKNRAL